MKLAVMQPYIFPYIGYFQLVAAVNTFIFYDDVNYIKGGWINRNRILLNGQGCYLTVHCNKASPNKQINEVTFDRNRPENRKLEKTISLAYRRAPYFNEVFPIIKGILDTPTDQLSVLAAESVMQIAALLNIKTKFLTSSVSFPETKPLDKTERLISLCKKNDADQYINPIGGKELYDKNYFRSNGIKLDFIQTLPFQYEQSKNEFIPSLSIIDVLMFNPKEEVQNILTKYVLL